MSMFYYKAKKGPDRTVEGEIDAESRSDALAKLEAMGLVPLMVDIVRGSRRTTGRHSAKASFREVTMFTRQLASLIRSGVPILRALAIIREQTEKEGFRWVVGDITNRVRDGASLSAALEFYPRIFPLLYIDLVKAGESAGKLDVILDNLANAREREEDIRRKSRAAMAYPILVLLIGIITVFVLLAFFMPQVIGLYKDFKTLPLPTRILIAMSNFLQATWHWILMVIILFFIVFHRISSMDKGQSFMTAVLLKIPLLRSFILETEIARFARTLALLIESGIKIDRAIELSAGAFKNVLFKRELAKISAGTVEQGVPFSEGLKKSKLFPPFIGNMAAVGENSGQLDKSLLEIAEFYDKNIEHRSRIVVSLIEPILILGVGVIVGFIVAAMLLPIFELGTGL